MIAVSFYCLPLNVIFLSHMALFLISDHMIEIYCCTRLG